MGKLVVTDASGATREFPLNKERVTIGRSPDNDISLNDKAVSGHHAVVITILQDSFLEDLDSTNGTQVNGKQIAKHPLSHADVVTIGRNTIKYEGEAASADEEFEKTMIIRPAQMGAAFGKEVAQATGVPSQQTTTGPHPAAMPGSVPLGEAPKPALGKLKVTSGPLAGKELELTRALTTLGRPGVQVAAITRRADGYYIVHVGGQGGGVKRPLVNAKEIDAQARRLIHNDEIELAGTKMTFLLMH